MVKKTKEFAGLRPKLYSIIKYKDKENKNARVLERMQLRNQLHTKIIKNVCLQNVNSTEV